MTSPVLSCDNIQKRFSVPDSLLLFENISLSIFPGETVAILGRSGSGKSSLLQILGLLDLPTQGTVSYFGHPVHHNRSKLRRDHIGFVFQNYHLLEDSTARENVIMPALIARKDRTLSGQDADHLLEKVGLLHRASLSARQLSGGEKQRVAIARALMNDPEIILADEPTGSLDADQAKIVENLLFSLVLERKKALVLVTHDPALAARCHRRFELQAGNLISLSLTK